MSIINQPEWEELRGYLKLNLHYNNGRHNVYRIFVKVPVERKGWALRLESECPVCGRKVHPVRMSERGALYFSVTCPLTVETRCCRTDKWHVERDAIVRDLEAAA